MKCKYCQAEIDEGSAVCPECGKPQAEGEVIPAVEQTSAAAEETAAPAQEETEKEPTAEEKAAEQNAAEIKEGVKATPGKIAMAIVAGVVLLAVLVALIVSGIGGTTKPLSTNETEGTAAATGTVSTEPEETVPSTIPADGNVDDVTCKGTYTVTDDEIIAAAGTVVATIGDNSLTNGQLQAYYWAEVVNFLNQFGDYSVYFDLDFSKPLDTQICPLSEDLTVTWQQYFLQCALDNWHCYQAMVLDAGAEGYVPEEDFLTYLEELPQTLEETAVSNGAADAAELVAGVAGAGCSVEDYISYLTMYNKGYLYYADCYDAIVPSDAEIEAYFTENAATYEESGITKDGGKYVDVRHILLVPEDENATTGEDGYPVYSDESWEACLTDAQSIYDQWLAGDMTEDSFAALANEFSADSDGTDGGLYTEVAEGNMVENFNNWCFDAARQVGDHAMIQTQYGYHIMYFVGSQDIWYVTAKADLIDTIASAMIPASMEKHPIDVDYTAIALGLVDLGY